MASRLKVIQSLEEEIVVVLIWMGWGCIVCPSVLFDTFDKKITDSNFNAEFLNVYAFINILMALSKVTEL